MEIRTRRLWSLLIDALVLLGLLVISYAATTASATPLGDGSESDFASIRLLPDESSFVAFGIDIEDLPLLRR
jgi:hypothetical protein